MFDSAAHACRQVTRQHQGEGGRVHQGWRYLLSLLAFNIQAGPERVCAGRREDGRGNIVADPLDGHQDGGQPGPV